MLLFSLQKSSLSVFIFPDSIVSTKNRSINEILSFVFFRLDCKHYFILRMNFVRQSLGKSIASWGFLYNIDKRFIVLKLWYWIFKFFVHFVSTAFLICFLGGTKLYNWYYHHDCNISNEIGRFCVHGINFNAFLMYMLGVFLLEKMWSKI